MSNNLHGQQIILTLPRVFFEAVVQSIDSLITPFTDKDFVKAAKNVRDALKKTLDNSKGEMVIYTTTNVFLEPFVDKLVQILYKEGLEIKKIEALKAFFWECDRKCMDEATLRKFYENLASPKEGVREMAYKIIYVAPWER